MNIVMFVGLYWIWSFKSDFIGLVSMISASSYYFDSNKDKFGHTDVKLGLFLASKYHLGSVALGSFIIPIMTFIKVVIVWPCHQIVLGDDKRKNNFQKILSTIAEVWLSCFEKLSDYLNEKAYAYMSIHG